MAATPVTYGWIDTSSERTHFVIHFPALTAVNFDAITGVAGTVNGVRTALDALTLLNETTVVAGVPIHSATASPPNDPLAQREYGVRVYFIDTVTHRPGNFFLSGVDSSFLPTNGDHVDLAITEWAALVTALEANCVSRDGNAIVVTEGIVTGRRK